MSRTNDIGRRCLLGCETWPDEDRYAVCPRCGEDTRRFRGVRPLPSKEAHSVALHAEFDYFYENEWVSDNEPLTEKELQMLGID